MGNKLDGGLKEIMGIARQTERLVPGTHRHLHGLEHTGGTAIRAAAFFSHRRGPRMDETDEPLVLGGGGPRVLAQERPAAVTKESSTPPASSPAPSTAQATQPAIRAMRETSETDIALAPKHQGLKPEVFVNLLDKMEGRIGVLNHEGRLNSKFEITGPLAQKLSEMGIIGIQFTNFDNGSGVAYYLTSAGIGIRQFQLPGAYRGRGDNSSWLEAARDLKAELQTWAANPDAFPPEALLRRSEEKVEAQYYARGVRKADPRQFRTEGPVEVLSQQGNLRFLVQGEEAAFLRHNHVLGFQFTKYKEGQLVMWSEPQAGVFVKTFVKLPTPAGGFKDNGRGYEDAAQALGDYIRRQMEQARQNQP